MLEELSQLITLQDLDLKIRALTLIQEELPTSLQELQAKLLETQTGLQEEELQLEDLIKQNRQLESEMELLDESIKRSRMRLMEIKEKIEYNAMLREIAFREDRKDQKETEILELLEEIEAHNTSLAQRHKEMQAEQQELARRQAEVDEQMAQTDQQAQELSAERPKVLQMISPELLKRYEFIRDRRNGTAIAEIRQGVCMACHMNIPPQQFIELQKEQEILTCPHCQRIIYWLGPLATEEATD